MQVFEFQAHGIIKFLLLDDVATEPSNHHLIYPELSNRFMIPLAGCFHCKEDNVIWVFNSTFHPTISFIMDWVSYLWYLKLYDIIVKSTIGVEFGSFKLADFIGLIDKLPRLHYWLKHLWFLLTDGLAIISLLNVSWISLIIIECQSFYFGCREVSTGVTF